MKIFPESALFSISFRFLRLWPSREWFPFESGGNAPGPTELLRAFDATAHAQFLDVAQRKACLRRSLNSSDQFRRHVADAAVSVRSTSIASGCGGTDHSRNRDQSCWTTAKFFR